MSGTTAKTRSWHIPDLILGVLVFCAMTAAVSAVGGDEGYFLITSSPSGAAVHVDGTYEGVTPVTVPIYTTANPSHTISLSLEGYQPWTQSYQGNPPAGQTIEIHADLVFIPVTQPTVQPGSEKGYYAIYSSPSGASVYFDGSYKGLSPVTVSVSTTGTPGHTISVSMSGYQTWTQVYSGNPSADQTITVTANLVPYPSYGSITVDSNPSQATATLEGGSSQVTPCTFNNVNPGTHTIYVTKSGYQAWSRTVQVTAGSNTPVTATLQQNPPNTGSLYIKSVPQGADVYVDGSYYGPAPQVASGLSPGYHQVRLSLSGFQTWTGSIYVTAGETTTINQALSVGPTTQPTVAGTGSIQVSSTPAGAQVLVDNTFVGYTPLTVPSIQAGSRVVLLKLSGYSDWQATVTVSAGKTTPVDATLSPVSPAPTKSGMEACLGLLALGVLGALFLAVRR